MDIAGDVVMVKFKSGGVEGAMFLVWVPESLTP
jgi:hypothetical protein